MFQNAVELRSSGAGMMSSEEVLPEEARLLVTALLGSSSEPTLLVCNGTVQLASPAAARLFAYPAPFDLVGKCVEELVTEEHRPLVGEYAARFADGREVPSAYRTRGLRVDGSEFDLEVRSTRATLRGATYSLVWMQDVTSTVEAERTVRQSREFYRSLFDVNLAVKLLIDPKDGRIVDANRAAMEFYGWSRERLTQMRISDINVLSSEEVQREMQDARSGKRRYFRFRHRNASGQVRHVEVYSGPVELDGRTLLLSIIHDVTERDELEERLTQSHKLETIGRLAGSVAHDLNNLLTVILACGELLEQETSLSPRGNQAASDLMRAGRRAGDLGRQLLAFSRRQLLQPRPYELGQLVHQAEGLLRRLAGPKVELIVSAPERAPVALVDPGQFERALFNLVMNARDAMPSGGKLTVELGHARVEPQKATVELPAGDYATVSVSDTGTGMTPEVRQRIFEPFFTTKADGHGSGLGLAAVWGTIKQSGGHIAVDSVQGQGTTFIVYVPVAEDRRPVVTHERLHARRLTPQGLVLLVDDEQQVRQVLAAWLEKDGLRTLQAASAEEALILFDERANEVSALVSDVVMPGLDGIELAHRVRARSADLPILLMSGDARNKDGRGLPPGVEILQKPFTGRVLIERLTSVLQRALSGKAASDS